VEHHHVVQALAPNGTNDPSMFATIMRTARISDLRSGHLKAEFVPKLRVEFFHRSDSEGCSIVTIERHSSDRLSSGPLYMHAPREPGSPS
jgi:hypothetical protein